MVSGGTALDLDAIWARLKASRPGPWYHHSGWGDRMGPGVGTTRSPVTDNEGHNISRRLTEDDAEFIAHAPEDIRALLREVERLRNGVYACRASGACRLPVKLHD